MLRVALVLPGGGVSGALYQVGALAALEDGIAGLDEFGAYIGHAGGAILASALAGGISANRLYRALLDPADPFFPLERHHVLSFDSNEWKRMIRTASLAVFHAMRGMDPRKSSSGGLPNRALEQLDRLEDSLPAGIFSLDRFERFLAEFFSNRGVPNLFSTMPRRLFVVAHELDTGKRAVFGAEGLRDTPVSLACAASCALPMFFSPVRIGSRHYLDGGLCSMAHFEVAKDLAGCDFSIVINPRVPIETRGASVPTGHGAGRSVRDKGFLWINNQARRMASQAMLDLERRNAPMGALFLEPDPGDTRLFLENQKSFESRRVVLEHAYRTTRARIATWLDENRETADRIGLRAVTSGPPSQRPPAH